MKHQLLLRSKIMRIRSIHLHFIEFNTCISGHLTFFFGGCTGLKKCNTCRLLLLITTLIHLIFLVLYGAIPTSWIKQQNIYTSGTVGWYFRPFPFEFSCIVILQVPGLITGGYPPVMTNIAIESGRVEIVSFPMNSMVMFHFAMLVITRR